MAFVFLAAVVVRYAPAADFVPLEYRDEKLVVDLGVGLWAWPLPMDFDDDGDLDLVVACPDVPYRGLYFFENSSGAVADPVFRPAVRLGPAGQNVCLSWRGSEPAVLTPGHIHPAFRTVGIGEGEPLSVPDRVHSAQSRIRANQWKLVDYDADGDSDLVVGIGDWSDYGWDNAFDEKGRWTNGPLHGLVYLLANEGSDANPRYAEPEAIEANGKPIDVYGMPSPSLADFDGDGDLDLVCGEFVDRLSYFENIGSRSAPRFAAGRFLQLGDADLTMDLCMIVPTALDWDGDGNVDLVVGQEDGRVALVTHTGTTHDSLPVFRAPRFFRQQAHEVKIGALVTPCGCDWDGDGDDDLICGDTAGRLHFLENLDGGNPPRWAAPVALSADGTEIRIMAGENGSIQGPCEAKWGYTVPCVADWNHDGRLDIVINSIWGEVLWYENAGSGPEARLRAAQPIEVEWQSTAPKPEWNWWSPRGRQLVTQWRTTPLVIDLDHDGLNDLVMLDAEGYLSFFKRTRQGERLALMPPAHIFRDESGEPLRLNDNQAGRSGRRKFCLVDWDGDGRLDLIANSRPAVEWHKNVGKAGEFVFAARGALGQRHLAGHTTCPTVVDWNRDGQFELIVGAEDGRLYQFQR